MRYRGALLAAFALVLLPGKAPALAADLHGVALVIGESDYDSDALRDLANPKSDARAMDDLLGKLGFDVHRALNDNRTDLESDIQRFLRDAGNADVALVYYSGHGVEAGGADYLVPTDADISTPEKAGESLVPVQEMLEQLARTVPVTITLLDACRTNAFPAGTTIALPGTSTVIDVATTGLGEPRGAVPIAKPGVSKDSLGMVIGFAASPGEAALDGEAGGNSPYAAALLKHFGAGGYPFDELMTLVRQEVYLKTDGRQLPWTNSSLRRVLSFGAPEPVGDKDQEAIREGRRRLLLSIADTPDDLRREVEAAATKAAVPMDAIYGLLQALGQKVPSDPAELDQLLKAQTDTIKKAMAEHTALTSSDPEIVRLSGLAQQALDEGALDLSVTFWEQAKDRYLVISKSLDEAEADLKARRLEGGAVIARTAQAYVLKGDYPAAAENYRLAFDQVSKWDRAIAATYKGGEADALETLGDQKGDNDALKQAIAAYGDALELSPRKTDRLRWANLQDRLGDALKKLGERESGTDSLNAAVKAYRLALKERSRKRVPLDWAYTQDHLGIALAQLGEREAGTDSFKAAIEAFHAALEEETRDRVPLDWATTQTNLAGVLTQLSGRETGTDSLKAAVVALRASLEVSTRDRVPFQWAGTQYNLGVALKNLGLRENDTDKLTAGVAAYRAALEVMTRDRVPLNWAMIQNALGNALRALGQRESGNDNLNAAVKAYHAALEEWTRDRVPLNWALAQNDLGGALYLLGGRETGTENLNAAIAAYRAALEETTRDRVPFDWAMIQGNIGDALTTLGQRQSGKSGADDWRAAIAAWQASAEIRTRDTYPDQWALLQNAIGYQLVLLGERENDLTQFEAAIPILRTGLAVQETADPTEVPYMQDSLCHALLGLGSRKSDRDSLMEAKSLCEAAIAGKAAIGVGAGDTPANLAAVNVALAKLN
ncbi:caspase family protein [Mesorhizobium sp. B2-3-4]|uniref:caspase family protein n=1 Tax=Mesorhizobium sp. B2-3-4 TaxID=2589959 RepID=UPI0011270796|nr:caspase family protein [Mesorhizobium sp. B2-3-4]TPM35569.1 caspase family protein [Mesorhizobium sp. B2-3-4]